MKNIKKIYKHAGKCDDQQNLKGIINAHMVSNTEGGIDNSPNVSMASTPVNKPTARKSLCLFTNILYVKTRTTKRRIGATKSKRRAMKVGNVQWTKKIKLKGNSKINENIKSNLYAWITRHSQVVQ